MDSRRILILFILLETAIIILAGYQDGVSVRALQTVTHYSAGLSLFLFSIIFLLQQKKEILCKWLSNRFYLLFAVVQSIHFTALFVLVILADIQLIPHRVAGAILACLIVFAMPVIQHYYEVKRLSYRLYRTAENVYAYYTWFIFFMTYLPRVQGKLPQWAGTYKEHVLLLGWISLLLGYRISGLMKLRFR